MEQKRKSLRKDNRGFTGLEAAIVLTAFVVVAAVFSYMVLNMGFFSTETAKGVIESGVKSSSSALQLSGDVIAKENSTGDGKVGTILVTLALASGGEPIDIGSGYGDARLTASYADEDVYEENATWARTWIVERGTSDNMLEYGEKVELTITVPTGALLKTASTATDAEFRLDIKPATGSILTIPLRTPSNITTVMIL